MTSRRRLRKQFKRFSAKTEPLTKLYSGALGIYIGGTQYVDVPDRPGFVYVRLMNDMSQLIQAHNQTVSPVYNLPVLVVRANNRYEIYGRDVAQYGSNWDTTSSYLPRHGTQHSFDPDNNGGGDLVFVHGEQFYPLMGFPSGTDGANSILIAPYRYYYNSDWHYAGDTGTPDLLQYRPTGSANAKLILVGLDAPTGNPFVKLGSEFGAGITGAAQLTDYIPTNITPSTEIPGTIVRLVTGTQTITWANIYDARQYMGILQAAAVTGSFSGSFLNLNDTPDSYAGQTERIVAVNNAGTGLEFRINTGSSGASNFLALTDTPDSYSGQASKFVSVNSGATGLEFVNSPAGVGGSGIVVYDDSVYKVTGTSISFDGGLDVAVTGSTAFVSSSAPVLIATSSPSGTNTVTFSNIPSNYNHLEVIFLARSTRAAQVFDSINIYFDGNTTGTSYRRTLHFGYAASTAGASGADSSVLGDIPAASSPSNSASIFHCMIPFYALTAFNKYMLATQTLREDNSSAHEIIYNIGMEWEATTVIDRIDFVLTNANYVYGSKFYLYGRT